jgi:hypothetical protein
MSEPSTLADRVYRCRHCLRRWKGFTIEMTVNGHLDQPRCPEDNSYMEKEP